MFLSRFEVSRRGLLAGAAFGGGLLVAWTLMPRRYEAPLAPGRGETGFNAWLKVGRDGVVTVAVPQLEMGQGVTTLLPQVVAVELGADWRQIAVEPAPPNGAYVNLPLAARWAPLWQPTVPALADEPDDWMLRRWAEGERFGATADGTSLAAFERPCREAAAAARAMLAMAAADRWDVAWEECEARGGFIVHGERSFRFADLAAEAADYTPPDPPPLRPEPAAERGPGPAGGGAESDERALAFPRLDLPSKVDGSYLFAGDVRLPGMVYAAIRHGPLDEAELTSFEEQEVVGTRGLVGVVRGKRWLAAAATDWWTAERALDAMAARFRVEHPANSARIEELLDAGVRRGEPQRVAERGEGDAALLAGMDKSTLALRYDVMPAAHGTIETASCTARLADGRLELWLASQAPERAREAAARALGLPLTAVVLYPMPAGGSFDARLEHDHAIEAALIAREIGRPVQLVWSRWQEHLALRPRPPVAAVLAAKLGSEGHIDTFRARLAMPPERAGIRTPAVRQQHAVGGDRRRGGRSRPARARRTHAGLRDPQRRDRPRARATLAPDRPAARQRARLHLLHGRELHRRSGAAASAGATRVPHRHARARSAARRRACSARPGSANGAAAPPGPARASPATGWSSAARSAISHSSPPRSPAKVACGWASSPRRSTSAAWSTATWRCSRSRAGCIYGVGLALGSALTYERGLPAEARLAALDLPTLADSPAISIDLVDSEAEPFDPGELAVAPVAPAIANALFSATGLRLRRLPLLSGGL